jgi:ketosteroid isomerase-like protein
MMGADSYVTPARRLVERFGDPDAMAALYHPDIEWTLPEASGRFAGPHRGQVTVLAFNRAVWGKLYFPDVTIEILDETGDEVRSSVRFRYTARIRPNGEQYSVEYALFAHCADGKLLAVHELLDTATSQRLFSAARKP